MIKYVKFPDERKEKYSLMTKIIEENGKTIVRKEAIDIKAKKHIKQIYSNYKRLVDLYGKEHIAFCKLINDSVIDFEYVVGETLSDRLLNVLKQGDFDCFYKWIQFYIDNILIGSEEKNIEFNCCSLEYAYNMDLIFENIILVNDKNFIIIDYEWLYENIPKKFILYRAINDFLEKTVSFKKILLEQKIFERYKINSDEINYYSIKEKEFQYSVVNFDKNDRYKKKIIDIFAEINNYKKEINDYKKILNMKEREIELIKNRKAYKIIKFIDKIKSILS